MTEVHVERGELDDGVVMVFKDYGCRVRMIHNPKRIPEDRALTLLRFHIPRLDGAMSIVRLAEQ